MAFTKIMPEDYDGKGVTGLADTPRLETLEMQRKFDELAKDVAIPATNRLVEELEAEGAADDIGIADDFADFPNAEKKLKPLLTLFAIAIKKNTGSNHSHENKSVLDTITETAVKAWNGLVSILSDISGIVTTITGDDTKIPTAGAVSRYVQKMGGGDMSSAVYDEDGDGVVNDSDKLGGKLPEYYQEKQDDALLTTDKTVVGAINEIFGKQPDVLDTLEEIEANTEEEKIAGALAVKEISSNLSGLSFGQDAEGNWGYLPAGADSVTPFRRKPTLLAEVSGNTTFTYDGADSAKLTADDFLIVVNKIMASTTIAIGFVTTDVGTISYDSSTGIVTISNMVFSQAGGSTVGRWTCSGKLYKI